MEAVRNRLAKIGINAAHKESDSNGSQTSSHPTH